MQKRIMNFTINDDVHRLPFAKEFPEFIDNINWVLENLHTEAACVPFDSDKFTELAAVNGAHTTTWQQIINNFLKLNANSAQYLLFDHQDVAHEIVSGRTSTDCTSLQMFYYGNKSGDLTPAYKMIRAIDGLADVDLHHLIDEEYLPYVKASWMFYLIRGIYQQALPLIQKEFQNLQINLDLDYRYLDISLNIQRKKCSQC